MNTPSDVLSALYAGKGDEARALADGRALDACEAAAMGDGGALFAALRASDDAHAMFSGDGWTPLHLAAFFGRDECTALLLTAGASHATLSRNSTGNTPLHAALAGMTNPSLVKRLIAAGADVNARGELGITPLHLAASRGDGALCDLLVSHGADLSAQMTDGTTVSGIAEARGHGELAARLQR